jgi:hypothetical protein
MTANIDPYSNASASSPIAAVIFTDPGATKHAYAEVVAFQDGTYAVNRVWYDTHNRSRLSNALSQLQRECVPRRIPHAFIIEVIVGVVYAGRDPGQVFATIENQGRMKDASEAHGLGFREKPAPEWRKQLFGYSDPSDDEVRVAVDALFRNPITKQIELPEMLNKEREHLCDAILGAVCCLQEMTGKHPALPYHVMQFVAQERFKTKQSRAAKRQAKESGTADKERRKPTQAKRDETAKKSAKTKAVKRLIKAGVPAEMITNVTTTKTTVAIVSRGGSR